MHSASFWYSEPYVYTKCSVDPSLITPGTLVIACRRKALKSSIFPPLTRVVWVWHFLVFAPSWLTAKSIACSATTRAVVYFTPRMLIKPDMPSSFRWSITTPSRVSLTGSLCASTLFTGRNPHITCRTSCKESLSGGWALLIWSRKSWTMASFSLNVWGAPCHRIWHVPIMDLFLHGTIKRTCGGFPFTGWLVSPTATSDQTWSTIRFIATDVAYSEWSAAFSRRQFIHAPAQLITSFDRISNICPVWNSLARMPMIRLSCCKKLIAST